MIHDWYPATAAEAEIRAWLDVNNACLARDLPDDPGWEIEGMRQWLTVAGPGDAYRYVVAKEAGELIGVARIWLLGHENRHTAQAQIMVVPAHRRRGIGRALLHAVVERLDAAGRRTVTAEVPEGTDGVGFVEALGFTCALRSPRSLLTLADVDRDRIAALAAAPHPGYEILCWLDEVPEEMLGPYAAAKRAMNEAPKGELDALPVLYDTERIRARVAAQHVRGNRTYRLVAVHQQTGKVAGLTELLWIRIYPTRGDQGDTCVVPAHRGHGLGVWMKAAEPDMVDVQTWNAEDNAHMIAVNDVIGYRRDGIWRQYQVAVADLAAALAGGPAA
jgi:GNAT superfamily N-acetyltransferase